MSSAYHQRLLRPTGDQVRQAVIRSFNLPSLCMGTATVLAGCVAAYLHNNFEFLPALACLVFAWFAQLTANIAYRYISLKHNFGEGVFDTGHTWRETLLPVYRALCTGLLIITAMSGLAIMELSGWWSIGLAAIIFILTWIDMAPPMALVRTPFGLIITFLLFGPIGVIGTSLVQSQMGTPIPFNEFDLLPPAILSLRIGLMIVCCHLAYCYVSYPVDLRNSKRTFTVAFGRQATRWTFLACNIVAYGIFFWMCFALDFRYIAVDMIIPTLYTLFLIWVWWYMGHGAHNRNIIIYGTLIAAVAVCLCNLILFRILQVPEYLLSM